MTLVELLHPLRNGKQRDLVLAVLFYYKHFESTLGMTASEIRAALVKAKVPSAKKMNVNAVLNNASPYVELADGKENGAFVFRLTPSGEKYAREALEVPEVEQNVQQEVSLLRTLSSTITDETVKGFVDEAIICLSVGALRAGIVFLWSGAIRVLHDDALSRGEKALNAALVKQDAKSRRVTKIEDFAWVKDRTFLDACPDLQVLDKGQKDTLVESLGLRNRCGHPTKYKPGENKAKSFIEDVVGIVWG